MTIDEAIAHEKIDSEPCSILCTHTTNRNDCIECRAYHKQLAEWLEELKDYRDKNKMVVRVDVENKDYIVQLVNTVAKTMIEVFENLTIEDVNMFQLGYNKAIDDIKEKLMQNGFIYTQHALDVFNEIAEQLKAGGVDV